MEASDYNTDRLFPIDALLQDLLKRGIRENGLQFTRHTGANSARNQTDDQMDQSHAQPFRIEYQKEAVVNG